MKKALIALDIVSIILSIGTIAYILSTFSKKKPVADIQED